MRYFFIIFILIFVTPLALAESCPTVEEIKAGDFRAWHVFSSDNGTPLPPLGLEKFKRSVASFALAEYAKGAPEGEAHCYYKTKSKPCAEGFLARHGSKPQLNTGFWYQESMFMRCSHSLASCLFT